jgi:2-hydroxychromene-2-carboxylate isomerase
MASSVDFYLDFSSHYAYIAQASIEQFAGEHGVEVCWRPIALGAIFKQLGHSIPDPDTPKGRYIEHDVERCAAAQGIPYRWPQPFPFNSIPAARGFYWLDAQDRDLAVGYARQVFEAAFVEGRDMADVDELASIADALGVDGKALAESTRDDSIKARLIEATAEAARRGVFGAPTFFAGDEMFWGADRMTQLSNWLRR